MTETAFIATVGLVALVLGIGLGYYLAARREQQADERAATAEAELSAYRDNVTDHFRETAVHFRALGEQYRSLHEHLAQGAESLCDTRRDDERLSFSPLPGIEGPGARAGEEATTIESEGEVIESAPQPEPAVAQATAAAETTSRISPPVDYELPGAAEPAAAARPASAGEEASGKEAAAGEETPGKEAGAAEAAGEQQSTDETRAADATARADAEPAQAEETPRKAEGDEPDIAVTPVDPEPARAKDEAPSRTIH
jgi:uncharacterized membrane-anchored protein YhcB (DUF1043 family)